VNLRKVLFTGGTGYLGSQLVRTFLAEGIAVGILTRGKGLGYLSEVADQCSFYSYDAKGLEQATSESPADVLIHAAASYGRNGESHRDLIQANFLTPLEIYQACSGRVGTWIIVGTGLGAEVSPYAKSKSLLSEWLRSHPGADVPWIELALQHFYGPGEDPSKFLSFVTTGCLTSDRIELTDGLQRRDFIHVDDVREAIRVVINRRHEMKSESCFEVGTGIAFPIRDIVMKLHHYLMSQTQLIFGALPKRASEPELCVANISALSKFGWYPKIPLEEGLLHFAAHAKMEFDRKVLK
jgi:CDP-paratose synthetase